MRTKKVQGKVWGSHEELEEIKRHLASYYNCTLSQTKPSDQGGAHFFFTIFIAAATTTIVNEKAAWNEGIIERNARTSRGDREWPNSP